VDLAGLEGASRKHLFTRREGFPTVFSQSAKVMARRDKQEPDAEVPPAQDPEMDGETPANPEEEGGDATEIPLEPAPEGDEEPFSIQNRIAELTLGGDVIIEPTEPTPAAPRIEEEIVAEPREKPTSEEPTPEEVADGEKKAGEATEEVVTTTPVTDEVHEEETGIVDVIVGIPAGEAKKPKAKEPETWTEMERQYPQIGWTIFPFVMGGLVFAFWICQGRERPKAEIDDVRAQLRVEEHFTDARHTIVGHRATQDALHAVEKVHPIGTATASDLAHYASNCGDRVEALLQQNAYTNQEAAQLVVKAADCYKLKLSQQAIVEAAGGILTLSNAMQALKAEKKDHIEKFQSAVHKVNVLSHALEEIRNEEDEHHDEKELFALVHHVDVNKDPYDEKPHGSPALREKGKLESFERGEFFANSLAFLTVYIPLRIVALLYVWYIWSFRRPVVEFAGYFFLISRMEGLLLALLTGCIVFLMTRGLLLRIRNCLSSGNALTAVIDKHVFVHRCLAASLVPSALFHTVAHNLALLRMLHMDPDAAMKLKGPMGENPSSYRDNGAQGSWPNITGWILWAILIGFCSLSIKRVRRPAFEVFHYPHLILTWLWVTFLISHGAMGWTGIGLPVCLIVVFPMALWYGIERGLQIRSATNPSIFLESALVYGKTMVLHINLRGSDYTYNTGMYSMVRVPAISQFQWHPFTIASSSEHQLRLVIALAGNWTKDLAGKIQDAQKKAGPNGRVVYPEINVRGGFGAPATGMHFSQNFIMVGAGVGATPFLSFLSSICNEWVLGQKLAAARVDYSHVGKARFYWVSRMAEDFTWVNHYQEILRTHPDLSERVSLHLILSRTLETTTQENVSAAELALFWHGLRVAMASGAKELAASVGVPTQFGRPNWEKEFVEMAAEIQTQDNKAPVKRGEHMPEVTQRTIGVYICGNDKLVKSLDHAAVTVSNSDVQFKLFAEEF
jgi:predicted ferric reductase